MSRSTSELWIEHLVSAVPQLKPLHDEHRADYHEVLPHVFLGDVARYVTQEFRSEGDSDLRRTSRDAAVKVLRVLEEATAAGDPDVLELVSVSFLENINWESAEGRSIHSAMGPELRKELSRREGP